MDILNNFSIEDLILPFGFAGTALILSILAFYKKKKKLGTALLAAFLILLVLPHLLNTIVALAWSAIVLISHLSRQ